jgi:filamentous hemagglutinin
LSWSVSEQKVRDYLLNVAHPVGGPKARFFQSRGFSPANWQVLAVALRQRPADNPVAVTEHTAYGRKLIVRCHINTPDGSNPCIRTVWMVELRAPARLVTAYPQGV